VATVGPASNSKEVLKELIEEGVDVFRLNFSHGTHEDHEKVINYINELNKELDTYVAILCDLQGPKIRIGEVDGEIYLEDGTEVILTSTESKCTSERLYINYPNLTTEIGKGERIMINDGKVELKAIAAEGTDELRAEVVYGGHLTSRKGVNFPESSLSVPTLTEKDERDLKYILTQPIHWIALSFVRTAEDIEILRSHINKAEHKAQIIAKIEKPEALVNIKSIIKVTDGIMIARGDLGVEVAGEKVPMVQKDIIRRCIRKAKPVIVATQMMESMIQDPRPTRAEINDVANAIIDGSDAVMLSGETAMGKYPVTAIKMMVRICEEIEQQAIIYDKKLKASPSSDTFLSDAVCYNAAKLSAEIRAKAIIAMTYSGYLARTVSSFRPKSHIFTFTANREVINTLNLVWGLRIFYYDKMESTNSTIADTIELLKNKGFLRKGDKTIHLASIPIEERGRTNMIKLTEVDN